MNFLKRLFCSHKYKFLGKWNCTFKFEDGLVINVPITFLECSNCGKRKVLRDKSYYYSVEVNNYVRLWEKGQIEVGFDE